jgi:hypothetical protein
MTYPEHAPDGAYIGQPESGVPHPPQQLEPDPMTDESEQDAPSVSSDPPPTELEPDELDEPGGE